MLLPASGLGKSIGIGGLSLLSEVLELVVLFIIVGVNLLCCEFIMNLHESVAEVAGSVLQVRQSLFGVLQRIEMCLELRLGLPFSIELVLEVAKELLEGI